MKAMTTAIHTVGISVTGEDPLR